MNIKTDRESVAALVAELIEDSASCRLENRELGDRLQLAADTLTALLAEVQGWTDNAVFERGRANGFEAEVARLSTPPDDAEVNIMVRWLRIGGGEHSNAIADALTRLSHALAAEREAMEKAVQDAFFEGFGEGRDGTWVEGDPSHAWASSEARATLAKHGSKT